MKDIKIHKFLECSVPIKACNMRCEYCYVTQNGWWSSCKPDYSLCMDKIEKALSKERLGGICMIKMCAMGETLIDREVVEITDKLLNNGHFIMIVTNGTIRERFEEFCSFSEEKRSRLFFKVSFHYLELKRINKLDVFFDNLDLIHKAGISFTVEITPDDSYIPYIDEIKSVCMKKLGALCHVTVPRDETKPGFPLMTKLTKNEFVKTWSSFNSPLFDFKESIFEVKRNEFCYAGLWSFVFDITTGEYWQCYRGKRLGNLYEDVNSNINEIAIGYNCPEGHCFNGHAFLGFGLIPEIKSPYFADMRNRKFGEDQWLSDAMEACMKCRLIDDNNELNKIDMLKNNIASYSFKRRIKEILCGR